MNILIIWTHPNEKSLSSSIAQSMSKLLEDQGHNVDVIDLYRSGFAPISEQYSIVDKNQMLSDDGPVVLAHKEKLAQAQAVIFVYPVWWWDRPALLKGWFDRIFRWGYAIDLCPRGHVPLLKGKRAFVIQTCGSPEHVLKDQGAVEVMHGAIADGTLELVGIQVDGVQTFYSVGNMNETRYQEIHQTLEKMAHLWKGL